MRRSSNGSLIASELPLPSPATTGGVDRFATLLLGVGLYFLLRKPVRKLLARTRPMTLLRSHESAEPVESGIDDLMPETDEGADTPSRARGWRHGVAIALVGGRRRSR